MLTFPYWEELRDGEGRFLPLVPVTLRHGLRYRDESFDAMALVDSGAEHNVFSLAAAEDLGYDLSAQHEVTIVGVGGAHTKGYATIADYQLGNEKWLAPIIFSEAVNDRPLLGQAGFFAYFNVTFRHYQREIRVTRSRKPRAGGWPLEESKA